jgi:molybdopterin-guanine dinucleotide biosynthesis protein A
MDKISLAILAGGASSRFGEPKHRVRLAGRWLLQELVERWRPSVARILLVGPREAVTTDAAALGIAAVFDTWTDCGPLSGIHAALSASPSERVFFLPCDMPRAPVGALPAFSARMTGDDGGVMLVRGGIPVPVCALYRRGLADTIAAAVAAGRTKITRALEPARFIPLDEAGLRASGLDPRDFAAFNTPDELREIFS